MLTKLACLTAKKKCKGLFLSNDFDQHILTTSFDNKDTIKVTNTFVFPDSLARLDRRSYLSCIASLGKPLRDFLFGICNYCN